MAISLCDIWVPLEGSTWNITPPATQATVPVEVVVNPVAPATITGVTVSINSGGAQVLTWDPTTTSWKRTLSRVAGSYTIIATATDSTGATRASAPVHFQVSSAAANANAPRIAFTQPAAGATLNGPSFVTIVDVQEDDGDGITLGSVEISIDGVNFVDMNGPT